MKAYYNHIKLFTQHFIPNILFVFKSVTDTMKHPVYSLDIQNLPDFLCQKR